MGDVAARLSDESDWEFDDWAFDESYYTNRQQCARRIKANDPSYTVAEIHPYGPTPTLSSWLEMGRDLGRNTEVKKLHICADGNDDEGDVITNPENLKVFFRDGLSLNRSLQSLQLQEIHCDDADNSRTHIWFETIHPFVQENPNLFDLRLYSCDLSVNDIAGLTAAFGQRGDGGPPMKAVGITEPNIGHELVRSIVELTDSCPELKRLAVGYHGLNAQACAELASLLENPNKTIKCLDLTLNTIDDEGVQVLANAVAGNTTLRLLALNFCDSITSAGFDTILGVVCNPSSINATFESNHTLEQVRGGSGTFRTTDDQSFCLKANGESHPNKAYAARMKIFHFHLSGDFDMSPFRDMDIELLPAVLAWVGKDCERNHSPGAGSKPNQISVCYRILKNFPDLCNFPTYERKMRLQLEAENALLRSQIERLQAENEELRSNKRPRKK